MLRSRPSAHDYFLLVSLSAILGSSFIFIRISVTDIPPATLVAARLLLAAVIMFALLKIKMQNLPAKGAIWGYIIAAAAFGNAIPFFLISWGQVKVEAGLTAIFMAIMPLSTLVLAQIFTDDEKLNRWKVASVFCGIAGIVILMGPATLTNIGDDTFRQLAILCAALCYAINAVLTRKLVTLPKLPMICALLISSTLMALPVSLLIDQPWQLSPTFVPVMSIVVLAIFPTALATWMILVIIDRQGASFLSQINFMVPLVGVLLGAVFLHERLTANAYIALGVILLAITLSRRGS
ncbi:hypothetical protein AB833_10385 [Chromatiales bacterium (ex Bugula neritina AB1)]|nr:hypothetical protein AB833_10385 [Chromatiales bacterium (ex Bugula neritina AB1)]